MAPARNAKALGDLPSKVRDTLQLTMLETVDDAVRHALVP